MAFKLSTFCAEKVFANWLIVINVLFGLFGIIMIVLGIVGASQADRVREEAGGILDSFDIEEVAILIMICGCATVATSACGFYGSIKRNVDYIKLYVAVLFLTCCMELGLGIYLTGLDGDSLREYWFEDTPEGYDLRETVQNYFTCCGWDYLTDTYPTPGGGLGPECPDYSIRLTCHTAMTNWLDEWVGPAAVASIVISVIEIISIAGACMILMTAKVVEEDPEDDPYHY